VVALLSVVVAFAAAVVGGAWKPKRIMAEAKASRQIAAPRVLSRYCATSSSLGSTGRACERDVTRHY